MTGNSTGRPSPAELARFDQSWAEVNRRLDDLIAAHRDALAAEAGAREVDVVGLGVFLHQNTDHEAASELLAVAIDRLVR